MNMNMVLGEDWQERLIDERAGLVLKLDKLNTFIANDSKFQELPNHDQTLLIAQQAAMSQYCHILNLRIGLLQD